MCSSEPCEEMGNRLGFTHWNYSGLRGDILTTLCLKLISPLYALIGRGPAPCWRPAYIYFMGWLHVPSLLCCMIGGLPYTVQMFSCAVSWLFFKWPLSQGMAGQHMETSALTIFLSKQQMALLLSFWSGTKIPMAEVLVYIEAAWQGAAWGFVSPNSSTACRCFLCSSHF